MVVGLAERPDGSESERPERTQTLGSFVFRSAMIVLTSTPAAAKPRHTSGEEVWFLRFWIDTEGRAVCQDRLGTTIQENWKAQKRRIRIRFSPVTASSMCTMMP